MMKKIMFVLILGCLLAGGVFADWHDRYAPGIADSSVFINAGIGWGFHRTYSMGLPPISVAIDYALPIHLPITIGLSGTYSVWRWPAGTIGRFDYTNIGIGARCAYHFNLARNLDVYTGITLGYVVQTLKFVPATSGESSPDSTIRGVSYFLYGGFVGSRYFFTNNLGLYLELGYSGLQVASIGLAMKF